MSAPAVVVDTWYGPELAARLTATATADDVLARLPNPARTLAARSGVARALLLLVVARGAVLVTTNPAAGTRTLVAVGGVAARRRLVLLEYIAHPPAGGGRLAPLRRVLFTVLRRGLLPRTLLAAQVLTEGERAACATSHGIPVGRFHHVPWPARSTSGTALPERVDGGRRVLCSGRRTDWETFAGAAADAGWEVTAVCAADDAERVHRLLDPVGARVLVEVPQEQHAAEVRAATAYVVAVPETGASIGQVRVMNAADAGTPLVVSRVAGVADYVDPSCAVLVEPGDPAALRAAVDALLADPARQRALREALVTRSGGRGMPEYLDEVAALVARHTGGRATARGSGPRPAVGSPDAPSRPGTGSATT
ncbi:hypothetical protein GCM10027047_37050 [Rhodococcus aerolatus]